MGDAVVKGAIDIVCMAWKHENVYIGGDAYAPKHWPESLVHYANTYGQDKFMFGTDWPVIDPNAPCESSTSTNFGRHRGRRYCATTRSASSS